VINRFEMNGSLQKTVAVQTARLTNNDTCPGIRFANDLSVRSQRADTVTHAPLLWIKVFNLNRWPMSVCRGNDRTN
jgi:hypothetical protein